MNFTKIFNSANSIHVLCFIVCVISTTIWSMLAFSDSVSSIIELTLLFISPYLLFGFYWLFRSPLAISASISLTTVVLIVNWLWMYPAVGKQGGLVTFFLLPALTWAIGVTIALAGALTQLWLRPNTTVTKAVIVFALLALVLNIAWYGILYATTSAIFLPQAVIVIGVLSGVLLLISRNKS